MLGKVISKEKSFIHGLTVCMLKVRFSQLSFTTLIEATPMFASPLKERRCWESDSCTREISEWGV